MEVSSTSSAGLCGTHPEKCFDLRENPWTSMVVICYIWYSMVILWLLLSIYFLLNEGKPFNQPTSRKRTSPPGFHQELQDPSLSPNSARAWATACPQKCSWPKNTSGLRLKFTPQNLWRKTWVCLKMNFHGRFSVYPVFMSYVLHLVHGCHRENDDKPPDFVGVLYTFLANPYVPNTHYQ